MTDRLKGQFNNVRLAGCSDRGIKGTDAESFIGSFRDECLNVKWFLSLEDTRDNSCWLLPEESNV